METSDTYRFPKLKGSDNYESWKMNIINALKVKGLWWVTSEKLKKSEISAFDVTATVKTEYKHELLHWEDKNDRACDMISFSIESELRVHISKIEIATQMWKVLRHQYEQSNLTIQHLAIKKLTRSRQFNFKSIQNYADAIKRFVIKCADAGDIIPEWILDHLFLLLSLNEGLKSYVFDLIQSVKINKLKLNIDDMIIALIDYAKRFNQKKDFSFKSMIFKTNKRKFKNSSRNSSKSRKSLNKTCSHCDRKSHIKQKCFHLNSKLSSKF